VTGKVRTVIVTLEIQTDIPLKILRDRTIWDGAEILGQGMEVKQVSVSVAQPAMMTFGEYEAARSGGDPRQVERRTPRRGVNVRHDDAGGYEPKRVRRGR